MATDTEDATTPEVPRGGIDRFFKITERGSTVGRELRGGLVTFVTMAYIVVLNPLIIGSFSATDRGRAQGHHSAASCRCRRSPRSRRWSRA